MDPDTGPWTSLPRASLSVALVVALVVAMGGDADARKRKGASATKAAATKSQKLPETPPSTIDCVRHRTVPHPVCSGVPPMPGRSSEPVADTCDGCMTDADCKALPGGHCQLAGSGGACQAPAAFVCRYPDDDCSRACPLCTNDGRGHALCRRGPPPPMPPSAPPRRN
jgi:hypothetical protein